MASDDNSDFDEDIILPNSPLAQYVKELDSEESANLFQECPASETIKTEKCEEYVEKSNNKYFLLKPSFLRKLTYWKYLLSICFLRSNLEKGNMHLNTFLNTTIKNCLLTQEDRSFIKHLRSETLIFEKMPLYNSSKLYYYLVLSFIFFFIIAYIGKSPIIILSTVIYFLVCIYILSLLLYCQYVGKEYQLCCLSLLSFPSSTKIAFTMIKDCGIRLIQEAELIARGFTSASVLSVAEHIELSFALPINSPSRQYSELRKCIFNWLRIAFIDYKALTLSLIQSIPVEKVFSSSNYLATLNVNEFGGFLNYELNSSEILEVTDNFSIQSLKTMHRLAEMQISEFYKQMFVRLNLMKDQEPVDSWMKIKAIRWLASCTQPLEKKMTLMYYEIYKTCNYYKSIEASYVDDKQVRCDLNSKSPKLDLKVTVHNMCLHLKAALLRLIELENKFDTHCELDQFVSRSTLDQLDINAKSDQLDVKTELEEFKKHMPSILALLNIVKSEVNAFDECCSKFNKILDVFLYPAKENPCEDISPVRFEPPNVAKTPTIIERCDAEREIHDEVFEAIVLKTSDENQDGAAFVGEEARKNMEVASFLLKELKNVLVSKADEHRVREQVALAKKMEEVNLIDNKNELASGGDKNITTNDSEEISDKGNISDLLQRQNQWEKVIMSDTFQKGSQCENEESPVEESGDFVLPNDNCSPILYNFLNEKPNSFAASIATIAAQRQKMLGLPSEEFIDGSDSDSDS